MVQPRVAQYKAGYQDLSLGNPTAPVSTKSPNLSASDAVKRIPANSHIQPHLSWIKTMGISLLIF